MSCITDIINGLDLDCLNLPFAGLVQEAYITNYTDVDRVATTFNPTKTTINSLVLNSGKKLYSLKALKKMINANYALVKKDNAPDKFKHEFDGIAYDLDEDTKNFLLALATGTRVTIVVERKFKGDGTTGFQVLGYDTGLEISENTWNANENDGMIPFKLASVDGEEEPRMPYTYLDNDYTTTKTAITAML